MALLLAIMCWSAPLGADLSVDTQNFQLVFSDYGDLVSARSCHPDCAAPGALRQTFSSYRGFVSITRDSDGLFQFSRSDGDHTIQLEFTNLVSNETRRWRIPHKGFLLGLEVTRPQSVTVASGEEFLPRESAGIGSWLESMRYVAIEDDSVLQQGTSEALPEAIIQNQWYGYRNRFWSVLVKPDHEVIVSPRTGEPREEVQIDLRPSGISDQRFTIFAGPLEPAVLARASSDLEVMMYPGLWGWLKWISRGMFIALAGIHSVVQNWAVAVIVLALLIQLLLWPMNRRAEKVQREVYETEAALAPRLREIKQSHKGAEQAERIMALYREEGVHPLYSLKGLLGLALIIPVFVGAFNMLAENAWLSGVSFLWIDDLSMADAALQLPFGIPLLGASLNLLPLIMTGLNLMTARIHAGSIPDQDLRASHYRKSLITAGVFFLVFYTFPAAMVLYWTVNNAFSLFMAMTRKGTAIGIDPQLSG